MDVSAAAGLPAAEADEVKAMPTADRLKFFGTLQEKQNAAAKLNGISILVVRAPGSVHTRVTPAVAETLPKDFRKTMQAELLAAAKEKKFDDGLAKALDKVRDAYWPGEKK